MTIICLSLLDKLIVDLDSCIFLEHIRGDDRRDIFVYARILGGDSHQKVIAVAATTAQIKDAYALQVRFFLCHQFVQGRTQKYPGDLVFPEPPDVVILSQQA